LRSAVGGSRGGGGVAHVKIRFASGRETKSPAALRVVVRFNFAAG